MATPDSRGGRRGTWLVPLVLGVLTMVAVGVAYHNLHKAIPPSMIEEARILSVDPVRWNDIQEIDVKLFDKRAITDAEWGRYRSYATSSNPVFTRKIARHLSAAGGTRYADEAHRLAKSLVVSNDPQTRANALISLRKFNDPEWQQIARRFLSDPSEPARKMGAAMLGKQADGK